MQPTVVVYDRHCNQFFCNESILTNVLEKAILWVVWTYMNNIVDIYE